MQKGEFSLGLGRMRAVGYLIQGSFQNPKYNREGGWGCAVRRQCAPITGVQCYDVIVTEQRNRAAVGDDTRARVLKARCYQNVLLIMTG